MELDTIELGDAYELIKKIPDKSIDLICTDPPYLYDDRKWFSSTSDGMLREREGSLGSAIKQDNLKNGIQEEMLDEWVRVLKKINVFVFCNKNQIYGYLDYFVKRHDCMFEILIWAKKNPVPLANGAYMHDKEYCLNFWEKGAKRTIKSIKEGKTVYFTLSTQKETKDYGHPTIKPLEMVEELVKIGALEGGLS